MAEAVAVSDTVTKIRDKAPHGVFAIYEHCLKLYPDQQNPIQVNTKKKRWLSSQNVDILDYISIYYNRGSRNSPPHWHYVSMGLSDLHGDGRVHFCDNSTPLEEKQNGFGFELTFRLKAQSYDMNAPPLWPAVFMQTYARPSIFQQFYYLKSGDYGPWHSPLDGSTNTIIRNTLLVEDPELKDIVTQFGPVRFIQIVGVTEDELTQAQFWNPLGFLSLMQNRHDMGGHLMVTDLHRSSILETDPLVKAVVEEKMESEGSSVAGIEDGTYDWTSLDGAIQPLVQNPNYVSLTFVQIRMTAQEALNYFPVVMKGRLKHERSFTFGKQNQSDPNRMPKSIVFCPPKFPNSPVSKSHPFIANLHNNTLYIYSDRNELSAIAMFVASAEVPSPENEKSEIFNICNCKMKLTIKFNKE